MRLLTATKPLERFLRYWRIVHASRYIREEARVLDIGCADGLLFKVLKNRVREGVGIDPALDRSIETERWRFISGEFPDDFPELGPFDVITLLAVLEHIPEERLGVFVGRCVSLLAPEGRVVMTVPSQISDQILRVLVRLGLIDGMSIHEHHGFDPKRVPRLFANTGLRLVKAARFQLGANNLFVFEKRTAPFSGGTR